MAKTTTYLSDYTPPNFLISRVNLDFALYDDHALVKNEMLLKRQASGALKLNGDGLELVKIALDDIELSQDSYQLLGDDLIIPTNLDEFKLSIVTRIYPQNNTELSGLYRSNHLFCTQCEAEGFRRITFFLDRPDVLAVYTTRISADKTKYPILLSNGNLEAFGDSEDGRHWVVWQDPFKKPSYLFALVAGTLDCVSDEFITKSGRRIDLKIYVEPGEGDKCAHALYSLKQAMAWDEENFNREYDLDVFMIVAVSDFNMGAMENKGLNIFNAKYILARTDTATDKDYAGILSVVAHEYFHNWTGNRITCRDWFQLSLKEGLTVFRDQEFSRDMYSRDVNRIQDVRVLRNSQFPEDAGQMAHPVRPTSYEEISNFYTATIYNKGAEVIRMQQVLLSKGGFRRGMDLYFERHDGAAVTIDDFVLAMEDANGVDFTQFKLWYSEIGTPLVFVHSEYENKTLTLHITQSCNSLKEPLHIPISVALFTPSGARILLDSDILELRELAQTFKFSNLEEKPVVSLLRDFSAPVILTMDNTEEDLLHLVKYESDGYAKWDALQKLALNAILDFYHSKSSSWKVNQALIAALINILNDKTLENALKAELLTPPTYEDVASCLSDIDVIKVCDARDFYIKELGLGLYDCLRETYFRWIEQAPTLVSGDLAGFRHLAHICLSLMMEARPTDTLPIVKRQFLEANNMTAKFAAFNLLAHSADLHARQEAIDSFYAKWKKDDLVLDKWFAVLATSPLENTLVKVRSLLKHEAFNIKNPNKVRALIGAFTQSNPRHFHAADGSGYKFLTEMLLQIDSINPQISARLAQPFTRLKKLDKSRQDLIKEALHALSSEKLSADLSEIVNKSLSV